MTLVGRSDYVRRHILGRDSERTIKVHLHRIEFELSLVTDLKNLAIVQIEDEHCAQQGPSRVGIDFPLRPGLSIRDEKCRYTLDELLQFHFLLVHESLVIVDFLLHLVICFEIFHLIVHESFHFFRLLILLEARIPPLSTLVVSELHARKAWGIEKPTGDKHVEPHGAGILRPLHKLREFLCVLVSLYHLRLFLGEDSIVKLEVFEVAVCNIWRALLHQNPNHH